jgi:hypothetical protein
VSRADVACHNKSVIKIKKNNVGNNKQFNQRKYASIYHEILFALPHPTLRWGNNKLIIDR